MTKPIIKSFFDKTFCIKQKKYLRNNYLEKEELLKIILNRKKQRAENVTSNPKHLYMINYLLFIFIVIILPKNSLSNPFYIKLKVRENGFQQILSNEYEGAPSAIYVNDEVQILRKKNVYVGNTDYIIKLEWNQISNFSHMFSNLTNIVYSDVHLDSSQKYNMSYMFYNCKKLESFFCNGCYIEDTRGMFLNCSSMKNFSFDNFFANANNINMSYMFYNCYSLETISSSKVIKYISDMKNMFYNCSSLISINLTNFETGNNNDVDLSHMFYNCQKLNSFNLSFSKTFYVKNMDSMFYNCKSLIYIDLSYISSTKPINLSRLFFNCVNLTNVEWNNFNNTYISDTREMFYNCISLKLNDSGDNDIFIKNNINNFYVNMSKMFYNCINLKNIRIHGLEYELEPNDFNSMFYNCISLTSILLENLAVHYVKNMSYMLYNCKHLEYFTRNIYSQSSSLIVKSRSMKGMFQNCESLITLDLSANFFTQNVENMWDMFKGCRELKKLILTNFDTSQVTDMESMFEGCSNLSTLDLSSFNTNKVKYMSKMFYNCVSLKSLDFTNLKSDSLSTMYQLFYNCKSLEYLKILSLTEKDQEITEVFKGTSNNFTFCIGENENIPNIFNELYNMSYTKRDCSDNCYHEKRISIESKKLCCRKYEYNGKCYDDRCPSKTKDNNDHKCKNFTCEYYYTFDQNDCLRSNFIPEGFFKNDTKTIDKCHEDCKSCNKKETNSSYTNCESCNQKKPYIYLGNCYDKCIKGYIDEANTECKCFDERCLKCSETSIRQGKCISCNIGYYRKNSDKDATTFECFKSLEKYYLSDNLFYPCYNSCQTCNITGNKINHNCLTCDSNYATTIRKNNYFNCYSNCSNYYYFDEDYNYYCTDNLECPIDKGLLIVDLGQCVKSCIDTDFYKYEFKNKCYSQCPEDTIISENNSYICELSCPFERPFKLVKQNICVSNCTIIERRDKLCVTHYNGNRTFSEIQNIVLNDIERHYINKDFNFSLIKENRIIIIEYAQNNLDNIKYELTTTKQKDNSEETSTIDFGKCEEAVKERYFIDPEDELYVLKYDNFKDGKTSVNYKLFYPLGNANILDALDLVICEDFPIIISIPANITGDPELYNKNSPYYNDICQHYLFADGVDKTLGDRQRDYIENNRSLCEEDCDFTRYDQQTGKVDCACGVKFNLPLVSEIKIDKNKLYNFMNIKKIANFDVLKCWKLITSKVGIIKNFGFYLFLPTLIMYIISIITLPKKDYKEIKTEINNIVYAKKYIKYINYIPKEKNNKKIKLKTPSLKPKFVEPVALQIQKFKNKYLNKNKKRDSNLNKIISSIFGRNKNQRNLLNQNVNKKEIKNKLEEYNEDVDEGENDEDNINNEKVEKIENMIIIDNSTKIVKNTKIINSPPIKGSNPMINNNKRLSAIKGNSKNISNISTENRIKGVNNNGIEKNGILNQEEKEKIKSAMKLNDTELNELNFKQALMLDNRTYFQYYLSLLKTKHIFFRIFSKNDYNSRAIKIFLLFFDFCLSFAVNALFFNDDTMHKILQDGGDFNFIYQLPQIIYSTIISFIIITFLSFLALSEDDILELKKEKVKKDYEKHSENVTSKIQTKFLSFFIFSLIILLGFWYYVICFCAVYTNTQYHLVKDTLLSFFSSLLTPLGFDLLPGLFRIPALKRKNEVLYLLSKLLQKL